MKTLNSFEMILDFLNAKQKEIPVFQHNTIGFTCSFQTGEYEFFLTDVRPLRLKQNNLFIKTF
jgi:hypothetical protein